MRNLIISTILATAVLLGASHAGQAGGPLQVAQAGCAAAAASAAQQRGGEVIGAPRTFQQDGRQMCEFTILIPDRSGEKPPRRERVVIELG